MTTIIFEFQKDEQALNTVTLYNVPITKQGIEAAVLKISALKPEQYDVSYIDSQCDKIMAAVEEDYTIAELTIEDDTIVFQIDVRADEGDIKWMNNQDQQSVQDIEEDEELERDCFHRQPELVFGQSAYQIGKGPNMTQEVQEVLLTKNQNSEAEPIQTSQQFILQKPAVQIQLRQVQKPQTRMQTFDAVNQTQNSVIETTNKQIQTIQLQKSQKQSTEIHMIQSMMDNKVFAEKMMQMFESRLPSLLKPFCFQNSHSSDNNYCTIQKGCIICKEQTKQVPVYLNTKNQIICPQCEPTYDSNQILVKIRNQSQFSQLISIKTIPIYQHELQSCEQIQKTITDLAVKKLMQK